MGAFKCIIIVEGPTPPQFMLGDDIGGGVIITEMRKMDQELLSASQLAEKYNLSINTIRDKLVSINQGTSGKSLYNPKLAHEILTAKSLNKRGRKRAN